MRRASRLCALLVVVAWSSGVAFAQGPPFAAPKNRTYSAARGAVLAPSSGGDARAGLGAFLRARGVTVADDALAETGRQPARGGLTIVRFEERVGGLPVYGVAARAAIAPGGGLVYVAENLVADAATPVPSNVGEAQALGAALRHHYDGAAAVPPLVSRDRGVAVFARTAFFHDTPTVTRVAYPRADGSLATGLLVETWSEAKNLLHRTLIGPAGEIAHVERRTNEDRYNIFPIDPGKTAQTIVSGPAPGSGPSPAGWLGGGTQSSTHITGNNVNAYLDVDSNNRADRGGTSVTSGEFLADASLATAPSTSDNRDVAVQNLFYLNNRIHDILYGHGFTESAGNFQVDNFGQGGAGKDPVLAEAQDGGGTDNANFATPSDGRSPRMQMYLWTGAGTDHEVVVGASVYGAMGAAFGPALTTTGVSGTLVIANDGTGTATDACEALAAVPRGAIVLVDRGTCTFVVKVTNAQAAGAAGVIVANNVDGAPFTMGGSDRKVRIPSVMVSLADGTALKALAGQSSTIRKDATPPLQIDGDLDSDVVYHEYGHGLTWRMIGGMSGPIAGALGEGASDVVAFLVNGDDRIGEYAASDPAGIRRYPYTNYPLTYKDVTGAEVHNDGEPYAGIMWRLHELFASNGISNDTLFGYFVDGMNYTPSTPAYEDMRDGMVQAAAASPSHQCLIWDAFAQSGVGVGASGTPNSDGTVTVVESYALPSTCP